MSHQVLARRWRPQSFDQMVGQEHVLRALVNALGRNRLHHAYLLTGTRGVGKTTLARLIAKGLNCEKGISAMPCGECGSCREIAEGRFVDLIEVDAASRTKVEDTRDLLDNVQYAPTRGRFKVYLIDEVHMLSSSSFNALLKTLEEPPPHVKFLLATTEPQKLPATVLSRCLQFHLKNLSPEQISAHLAEVLRAEQVEFEDAALWDLALAADGSVRDALSLTDQAIAYCGGKLRAAQISEMLGHVSRELLQALMMALLSENAVAVLAAVDAMAQQGVDFERALVELLTRLHRVALAQNVPGTLDSLHGERDQTERWAAMARPEDVQLYYQIGVLCRRDMPYAPDPRSGLEMALLRMLAFRPPQGKALRGNPSAPVGVANPAIESPRIAAPEGAGTPPKKPEPAPQAAAGATALVDPEAVTASVEPLPVTLDRLRASNWAALLDRMDLGGMARNVAANSIPESSSADAVTLVLEEKQSMLYNAQCDERIAAALSGYFGLPVTVSVRLGNLAQETPAGRDARRARERQLEAERSIDEDPNVKLLVDSFAGRLHRNSVRARQLPGNGAYNSGG